MFRRIIGTQTADRMSSIPSKPFSYRKRLSFFKSLEITTSMADATCPATDCFNPLRKNQYVDLISKIQATLDLVRIGSDLLGNPSAGFCTSSISLRALCTMYSMALSHPILCFRIFTVFISSWGIWLRLSSVMRKPIVPATAQFIIWLKITQEIYAYRSSKCARNLYCGTHSSIPFRLFSRSHKNGATMLGPSTERSLEKLMILFEFYEKMQFIRMYTGLNIWL